MLKMNPGASCFPIKLKPPPNKLNTRESLTGPNISLCFEFIIREGRFVSPYCLLCALVRVRLKLLLLRAPPCCVSILLWEEVAFAHTGEACRAGSSSLCSVLLGGGGHCCRAQSLLMLGEDLSLCPLCPLSLERAKKII